MQMLLLAACSKNKIYDYCQENPCQFNEIVINGTIYNFNTAYLGELNGANRIVFSRFIRSEFPIQAEHISFSGIPDAIGLIYLKKGDALSGFPVVKYCYEEEDVCIDNSAPYDSTGSWIEVFEIDSSHIRGHAELKLYRSDNAFPSTFYGDVDTLNIKFDFEVFK
jgi:hypothetical protein